MYSIVHCPSSVGAWVFVSSLGLASRGGRPCEVGGPRGPLPGWRPCASDRPPPSGVLSRKESFFPGAIGCSLHIVASLTVAPEPATRPGSPGSFDVSKIWVLGDGTCQQHGGQVASVRSPLICVHLTRFLLFLSLYTRSGPLQGQRAAMAVEPCSPVLQIRAKKW